MAENQDFYREALKAFDAPILQPKQEEPAREAVAEVTESAPQEKPKRRFSPWWAVALCAAVCLALVIGFGWGRAGENRGENYIYGNIVAYGEGYITLATGEELWYVQLEGLEPPKRQPNLLTSAAIQPIWVFYNGEPVETDQNGCTKRITATFWKTEESIFSSRDEIGFDLDGDGRKETWSVNYTMELPSLHASTFAPRLSLRAEDARGNILYSVSVEAPAAQSAVFNNAGGKLSVVLYENGFYSTLDLRLENGELAVYRLGEKLVPDFTEPTAGTETSYSICFALENLPDGSAIFTKEKQLSEQEGAALDKQLQTLNWSDGTDELHQATYSFVLTVGEALPHTYRFADGLLLYEGRTAKPSLPLQQTLLKLMDWEMPAEKDYYSYLENGDLLRLRFTEDGAALLRVSDEVNSEQQTYSGRYAVFGDYYYLALGDDLNQTLMLQKKENSFAYIDSGSDQSLFPPQGQMELRRKDFGGSLSVSLRNAGGLWNSGEYAVLPVADMQDLRNKLKNRAWQSDTAYTDDEIVARFTVYDGVGADLYNPEKYYLLTGCRLLRPVTEPGGVEAIATVDEKLWNLLVDCFCQNSEALDAAYTGLDQNGENVSLQLSTDGVFILGVEHRDKDGSYVMNSRGFYLRLGTSLALLGWDNGPYYIGLDLHGDDLVYDAVRSTPNQGFQKITQLTLQDLKPETYRTVDLTFAFTGETGAEDPIYTQQDVKIPEGMALLASGMLRSLQWEKLEGDPTGIYMGSFTFPNAEEPYQSAAVYSGMRLVYGGYEAKLDETMWAIVCQIMGCYSGQSYVTATAAVGEETYVLMMSYGMVGILCHDGEEALYENVGYYSIYGDSLALCYFVTGDVAVLQREDGAWRLLPGYNGITAYDIPDGILFVEQESGVLPEYPVPA